MPIYEYQCASCGFQKEYLQKVSDPKLTVCPQCGKETFNKMLTAAGFQLKGSGWYATDFKNGGKKPAGKTDESAAKSSDKPAAGGSTTSDGAAKPEGAAKTDSTPAAAPPAGKPAASS